METRFATVISFDAACPGAAEVVVNGLPADVQVVFVFATSGCDLPSLATRISTQLPAATVVACTTCGEIGPGGCSEGSVVALGLRAPARAAAVLIEQLEDFDFHKGAAVIGSLAGQLGLGSSELLAGQQLLITLTDGLSGAEELLVASLGTHAPQLPLVGGSAGDDFHFERTWVAVNGVARCGAGVVVLLEPGVPHHPFHLHHYTPGARRLVVTHAEPQRRLLRELDGWPAADVLAELLGVEISALHANPTRTVTERAPTFGFRAGGTFFLRSVMTVRPDGALLMGGAIEEGTILRPMLPGDLVGCTARGVNEAIAQVPSASALLLFNCGGRLWEARSHDSVVALGRAMTPVTAAGFTTYGEQFGPLQLNHTLTGLVLGSPDVG